MRRDLIPYYLSRAGLAVAFDWLVTLVSPLCVRVMAGAIACV